MDPAAVPNAEPDGTLATCTTSKKLRSRPKGTALAKDGSFETTTTQDLQGLGVSFVLVSDPRPGQGFVFEYADLNEYEKFWNSIPNTTGTLASGADPNMPTFSTSTYTQPTPLSNDSGYTQTFTSEQPPVTSESLISDSSLQTDHSTLMDSAAHEDLFNLDLDAEMDPETDIQAFLEVQRDRDWTFPHPAVATGLQEDVTSSVPALAGLDENNLPEQFKLLFNEVNIKQRSFLITKQGQYLRSLRTGRCLETVAGNTDIPNQISSNIHSNENGWFLVYLIDLGFSYDDIIDRVMPKHQFAKIEDFNSTKAKNSRQNYPVGGGVQLGDASPVQMDSYYLRKNINKRQAYWRSHFGGLGSDPKTETGKNVVPTINLQVIYRAPQVLSVDQIIRNTRCPLRFLNNGSCEIFFNGKWTKAPEPAAPSTILCEVLAAALHTYPKPWKGQPVEYTLTDFPDDPDNFPGYEKTLEKVKSILKKSKYEEDGTGKTSQSKIPAAQRMTPAGSASATSSAYNPDEDQWIQQRPLFRHAKKSGASVKALTRLAGELKQYYETHGNPRKKGMPGSTTPVNPDQRQAQEAVSTGRVQRAAAAVARSRIAKTALDSEDESD